MEKENKKMGRPKKQENALSVDLKVRITEETNKKLLIYSKKNNITRAEAVRLGIEKIIENE